MTLKTIVISGEFLKSIGPERPAGKITHRWISSQVITDLSSKSRRQKVDPCDNGWIDTCWYVMWNVRRVAYGLMTNDHCGRSAHRCNDSKIRFGRRRKKAGKHLAHLAYPTIFSRNSFWRRCSHESLHRTKSALSLSMQTLLGFVWGKSASHRACV